MTVQDKMKRIAIVGATSAIATHCARLWLRDAPAELILIGRSPDRLARLMADLRVRSPESVIRTVAADFVEPVAIRSLVDGLFADGPIDIALIAHGTLPDQQECQADLAVGADAIIVNGLSPVLIAEAMAGHMEKLDAGTLIVIGSVAGDRGRKSNYVYGAAKGMVDRYVQGLQHRFAMTSVKLTLVKPGPTETPMTAHLKQQGMSLASVEDVAKAVVDGAAEGKRIVYAPRKWALIMMIIRHLPHIIFARLNI